MYRTLVGVKRMASTSGCGQIAMLRDLKQETMCKNYDMQLGCEFRTDWKQLHGACAPRTAQYLEHIDAGRRLHLGTIHAGWGHPIGSSRKAASQLENESGFDQHRMSRML
jgi:hypothetical protein